MIDPEKQKLISVFLFYTIPILMSDFDFNNPFPQQTPQEVPCNSCGGSGSTWAYDWVTCSSCAGSGRDTSSDLWALPCSSCNGKGGQEELVKETCSTCGGSGTISAN